MLLYFTPKPEEYKVTTYLLFYIKRDFAICLLVGHYCYLTGQGASCSAGISYGAGSCPGCAT